MPDEIGPFEAIYTQRAIRQFKPDPVPDAAQTHERGHVLGPLGLHEVSGAHGHSQLTMGVDSPYLLLYSPAYDIP
jgi:hypothetical protein